MWPDWVAAVKRLRAVEGIYTRLESVENKTKKKLRLFMGHSDMKI